MKRAFVTQTTDSFVFGTKLLLKSFLHFNKFEDDIIVMYEPGKLSNESKNIISEFDVIFHECSTPDVQFRGNRKWAINAASRFDIFKLPYDRVLYYDSDILIMDDVSEFINNTSDFVACAYTHKMTSEQFKANDNMTDCNAHLFNAGVLNISKKHLTDDTYNRLIEISTSQNWPGNQGILNKHFSPDCTLMSNVYNLTTSEATETNLQRCKVLHFVGHNKIWNTGSYVSKFDHGVMLTIGFNNCTYILRKYRKYCKLLGLE